MIKIIYCFLVFILLVIEFSFSIKVLNSTISKKEVNVFGNQLNYAVFEFELDQELYKYDSLACPNFNCDKDSSSGGIDCTCDYTDPKECPKLRDSSCTNDCPLVDVYDAELCNSSGDNEWTKIVKDKDYYFKSSKTILLRYKADSSICEGVMIQNYAINGFYKLSMGKSPDYLTQRDNIYSNPLVYGVFNMCPSDNVEFLQNKTYNQGWTNDTFYLTIVPFTPNVEFEMYFRLTSKPVPPLPSPAPVCTKNPSLTDHTCLSDGVMESIKIDQSDSPVHHYYVFKAEKSGIHTIRSPSLVEAVILLADDNQTKPNYNSVSKPPKWASKDGYENSIIVYLEKDQEIYIAAYLYWATPYVISITSQAYYSPVSISTLPSKAAMFGLVKSSRIFNSNTIVTCEQWSQCFLYTIGVPYSNNNPVSPLPPTYLGYYIQDSLPSYYELIYNDTLLNPLKPKVYQAAFLMSYKIGSSTLSTLVSWETVLKTRIEFLSTHFDINGQPLSDIISNYTIKEFECNYNGLNEIYDEIEKIEKLLYDVSDIKEMNNLRYQIDSLTALDSYIGCTHKATSLLEKKSVSKNVTGTFCELSTNDPKFQKDPCCSLVERYKQCCNPVTKTIQEDDYIGVFSESIKNECSNPACTETVVDQYFNSLSVQDECSIPSNALDSIKLDIITTLRQCQADIVFNIPSCSNDLECKTFSGPNGICDRFTRKCLPNYQYIDQRYLKCIFSQLDQATIFKLIHKPFTLNDTIIQELYNYYQSDDCINQGTFNQRQAFQYKPSDSIAFDITYPSPNCLDDTCKLVHDTIYDGIYSFNRYWLYNDDSFTNCETFGLCNSNPTCYGNLGDSSIQSCVDDCNSFGDFCGYCSNSTDSLCYNFGNSITDETTCTSKDYCLIGNNNFYEDLSEEQCQEEVGYCDIPCGYSCGGFVGCAVINISNETLCSSIPSASWDTTFNLCKYDVLTTQDQCTDGSGQLGWIDCSTNLLDECSGPTFSTIQACSLIPKECTTKSECESAGVCSDSYFFSPENTKLYPLGLGKCVRDPQLYRYLYTCEFSYDDFETERSSPMGCFTNAPNVFTRQECEKKEGYKWWSPAVTKEECISIEGCQIFQQEQNSLLPFNYQFNQMDKDTCLGCYESNNQWTNKFQYRNGKWTSGIYVKGQWIQSEWIPTSVKTTSLSYQRIYNDLIEISANAQMADLIRNEYFCRSFRIKDNLDGISCSCSNDGNGDKTCFKDTALLLGQNKPCSNKANNYTFDYGQIQFDQHSVQEGCGNILVSQIPQQIYTSSRKQFFPSGFVSYPDPPKYSISNDKNAIIGTLLGDGVSIESQGIQSFTICFKVDSYGNSQKFPILDIATIDELDQKIYPINSNVSTITIKEENGADKDINYLCSKIQNIQQKSTYFPINRINEWQNSDKEYFDNSTEGLLYTLAALFLLSSLYGFYQIAIIIIVRFKGIIAKFELVHTLILMTFIFVTVRMIYFFLLPKGYLAESSIADYSLVVIPTFFYFSSFTIILVLWYTIVFLVLKNNASSNLSKRVKWILLCINALIYALLVIIIIVFQFGKENYNNNCGNRILVHVKSSSSQKAVSILYAVIQAAISFVIGSLFIYLGGSLWNAMRKSLNVNSNTRALKKTKKIFLLTTICSTAFLLHCIFILVLVGIENPSVVFSFVGLIITEIIPSITIFYCYDQRVSLSLDKTLSVKTLSTSSSADKTESKLTNMTERSENLSSEF